MKITFIGAGSLIFTQRLLMDLVSFPFPKEEIEVALVDIDTKRLSYIERIARRLFRENGLGENQIFATTERREALPGTDYVFISILVGGIEVIQKDIEIPLKYGVDQCIGDTIGPGGVFRALRTTPVILDICRDIEELCSEAVILNYTNPMSILCWVVKEKFPELAFYGLCHSVQHTARQLASYLGVPFEEIEYWVAGINHQAWFLELRHKGEDLYPRLRKAADRMELWVQDTTRFEMFKHLGYFVTESSGHNSEYNPWFRKRKDLLEKFTPGGGWNGETGFILKLYGTDRERYEEELEAIASGEKEIDVSESDEYGIKIIYALESGETFRANINLPNKGLITNLPGECIVEVPCFVERLGIRPASVGDLPLQLAALNRMVVQSQEMAVKGILEKKRDYIYYSLYYDPLTSAVLSLDEIKSMVDEMFEAEKEYLPDYWF
ncbi:alpha-galactosidase [Thermatribacter velox]|uniref:Alpha-galactosidase n=1 Tax=Thermatribacter velox TaxID=3039681 RepID=A0ABZ2Y8U5_9BACT